MTNIYKFVKKIESAATSDKPLSKRAAINQVRGLLLAVSAIVEKGKSIDEIVANIDDARAADAARGQGKKYVGPQ